MKRILFVAIFIFFILTSSMAQDIPDRNLDTRLEAQYKAEHLARIIQLERGLKRSTKLSTWPESYNWKAKKRPVRICMMSNTTIWICSSMHLPARSAAR